MKLSELVLSQDDLPLEPVDCSPWKDAEGKPVTLYVRADAASLDEWDAENVFIGPDGKRQTRFGNMTARLLVKIVVDASGQRVFTDAQAEQLGAKSGAVLRRLYNAAMKVSGRDGVEKKDSPSESGSNSVSP